MSAFCIFKCLSGRADAYVLLLVGAAMAAGAFMVGGVLPENRKSANQAATITPSPISQEIEDSNTYESDIFLQENLSTVSSGEADLVVVNFSLTDRNGIVKTTFDPGERIYPKVTYNNIGSARILSESGYINSQIYDNQQTPAQQNQQSDVNVWMRNGRYGVQYIKTYEARPDGLNSAFYKGERYWIRNRSGTFTARVYLNYDHGGIETNFENNQRTVTYTIRNLPSPTPTKKPTPTPTKTASNVGDVNAAPNSNSCGGKYSFNNPIGLNFGDPACTFTKDKLYSLLKQHDSQNADYWFYTVIPCESPGYNANLYYRCGPAGCTPDPSGAWGLFQMGRGRNGQYDHGDVAWPRQVTNATTYRQNIGWGGWRYWACAQSRW